MINIDRSRYYGLLNFLRRWGRGTLFVGVLFFIVLIPTSSIAAESQSQDANKVGELLKKMNFSPSLFSDPFRIFTGFKVPSSDSIDEALKGPITSDKTLGNIKIPSGSTEIPKDLSGQDFWGTLKIIVLFIFNIVIVLLEILLDIIQFVLGLVNRK